MKILLLHDVKADKQNGVSVSLGILSRELRKAGYSVKVLTLADGNKSEKDGDNYYLSSVPAFIYPGIRMRPLIKHRYVDELIAWNPDVIHTNCEFSTFRTAEYIHKHSANTPAWIHTFHTDYKYYIGLFQHIHTVRDKLLPRFLDYCFHKCDALIVPTEKMYTYVKSDEFVRGTMTRIIPTGIDFSALDAAEHISPEVTKQALGLPMDERIVLFLGRISAEKNLDELFSHFATYAKTHDKITLLTVGDGPYKEELVKLAEGLGIRDRVILHDGVPHSEIRQFYDACDVFASASVSETQGLTFYEALYCGVPVLAKDKECLEGAVTHGENGAYFTDAASFAESLDMLRALREKTRGNKPQTLPKCFESEYFAKSVAALYEEAFAVRKIRKKREYPESFEKLLEGGKHLRVKMKSVTKKNYDTFKSFKHVIEEYIKDKK